MELGKKIKKLRLGARLTQNELAEKLGLSPQSVSKWENGFAMPDISALPLLAEIFGVTIDDLFDLTAEQRFNRIEHRMEMFSKKAGRYAREAVRLSPGEKGCQWILQKAEGHFAWEWNINNHTKAVEFYKEIVRDNPDCELGYLYLLDNLIADHRADEAEEADGIMERLSRQHPEDFAVLFETAQYYAAKSDYEKAVDYYERSFAAETCGRITMLLRDEWGITEGDELTNIARRKESLLARI